MPTDLNLILASCAGVLGFAFGALSCWRMRKIRSRHEESQKLVQNLIEAVPGFVSFLDSELRYVISSETLAARVHAGKLVGRQLGSVFPDSPFVKIVRDFWNSGDKRVTREVRMQFGELDRWCLLSMARTKNPEGLIIISLDIEDLKTAQRQMEEQRLQLASQASLAEIGTMAAGVAHEINNPITVIGINAESLLAQLERSEWDPVKARTKLERITNTTQKVARIVKGMKLLAHQNDKLEIADVPLCEIARDAEEIFRVRLREHNVVWRSQVPSDLVISGQAGLLAQVLLNLVNNAVDAMADVPEKQITLTAEKVGNLARISVTDNGPGIPEAIRPKILNPFFTTKPIGKGTGLGLSICSRIAQKHGGRFYLDESYGAGARFVIEIPLAQAASFSNAA